MTTTATEDIRIRAGRALIYELARGKPDAGKNALEFIRLGADVTLTDPYGMTALMFAVQFGHDDVAVALLARPDIDVNARNDGGMSALMIAALKGSAPVLNLLLKRGADVHAKNKDAATALHIAAGMGRTEAISLLLAHGADVSVQDAFRETALKKANRSNRPEAARLLCAAHALRREAAVAAMAQGTRTTLRTSPLRLKKPMAFKK